MILPKALHRYKKVRFVDQKRAQFTYYLLLALIVSVILLIISSSYLHNLTPEIGESFYPVILPMIGLLLILMVTLRLLLLGRFKIAAHLLLISTLISTWLVMIFDDNAALIRLDTIVLIMAVLSMLPIMIQYNKYKILIYTSANLFIFLVFIFAIKPALNISAVEFSDYLIDVIIALLFLGFVNYNIFSINQAALEKATNDIAERKKAEKALLSSEKRYREMTDLLPVTVFETNKEGLFSYINNSGLKKLGYQSFPEASGINILSHIKDVSTLDKHLNKLKVEDQLIQEQLVVHDTKSNFFTANIYVTKILEGNDFFGYRGVIIDISDEISRQQEIENYKNHLEELVNIRTNELKKANQDLKNTNADLDLQKQKLEKTLTDLKNTHEQLIQTEKMASLGILTAGVAHEINNPLNFIQGGYSGLKQYFQKHNQKDQEVDVFLKGIKSGIDRSAAIVSSLNHFSRQKESFDEICDIYDVIDNCLLILNNQLKGRIMIEKNYQAKSAQLMGNSGKLHQVFLNILNNAGQAIIDEGTIRISITRAEQEITIEINDNGVGINPKDLPKVLDPFFTTKEPGKGTGLGLSISNSIIKEHEGTLKIKSEPGTGTRVIIALPVNQSRR